MADAETSREPGEVRGCEDVTDQTLTFLDVKQTVVGDDPCGILATVLHGDQPVVDLANGIVGTDDTDKTAHDRFPQAKTAW